MVPLAVDNVLLQLAGKTGFKVVIRWAFSWRRVMVFAAHQFHESLVDGLQDRLVWHLCCWDLWSFYCAVRRRKIPGM